MILRTTLEDEERDARALAGFTVAPMNAKGSGHSGAVRPGVVTCHFGCRGGSEEG